MRFQKVGLRTFTLALFALGSCGGGAGAGSPTGVVIDRDAGSSSLRSDLNDLCAHAERRIGSRVTLSGDFVPQSSCTAAWCDPGVCCNECSGAFTLPCPDGVHYAWLWASPGLELPQLTCGAFACDHGSTLACFSYGDNDGVCSRTMRCIPTPGSILSAAGVVDFVDGNSIVVSVDSLLLSSAP